MLPASANAPAHSLAPGPFASADAAGRLVLAPHLESRLWRGSSLSRSADPVLPSGFAALDAELPGGGWPLRAVTELLTPQFGVLEWRLLASTLRRWWAGQALPAVSPRRRQHLTAPALRSLLLVNPPYMPHMPGQRALGLPPSALICVAATTPAQQLWVTEQAIKSRIAVMAWLPEARPTQLRRLQVAALGSDTPTFLLRPWAAQDQSSAAPLRLLLQPDGRWKLQVRVLKRRGPAHDGWLSLPSIPPQLETVLTPRMRAALPSILPKRSAPRIEVSRPTHHHALARPVVLDDSLA